MRRNLSSQYYPGDLVIWIISDLTHNWVQAINPVLQNSNPAWRTWWIMRCSVSSLLLASFIWKSCPPTHFEPHGISLGSGWKSRISAAAVCLVCLPFIWCYLDEGGLQRPTACWGPLMILSRWVGWCSVERELHAASLIKELLLARPVHPHALVLTWRIFEAFRTKLSLLTPFVKSG